LAASLLLGSPVHAAQNSVQTSTISPLPGLTLVTGLNAAALNYITLNSGASAPTPSGLGTANTANVIWQDTGSGAVKVRNSGDTAWVRLLDIDPTNNVATALSTVLSSSAGISVSPTEHFGQFVATAAENFTLAQTSTLWNGFAFSIFAEAGAATVGINATDAINAASGGTAGVGAIIPKGYVGEFTTDGAGNWTLIEMPAGAGTGSIASASTTDLCSVGNPYVTVTGTTAVTNFGPSCQAGQTLLVRFSGSLTLTYNATSLILPNNATNITTAAGDTAQVAALGSGNYVVTGYARANGQALEPTPGLSISSFLSVTHGTTNWSKPAGITFVYVYGCGAGGGGANGAIASGTGNGGGGGGGGSCNFATFPASSVSSSVVVTIGQGGAANTAGGNTSFGALLTAYGRGHGGNSSNEGGGCGAGTNAVGANAGASACAAAIIGGGINANSSAGGSPTAEFAGAAGGSASSTGGSNGGMSAYGGPGGGSGGSSLVSNYAGGVGGTSLGNASGGSPGTGGGNPGSSGGNGPTGTQLCGSGGGGGGSNLATSSAGGAGGAGGTCAGGGGGGAGPSTGSGGAGAAGGDGLIFVLAE